MKSNHEGNNDDGNDNGHGSGGGVGGGGGSKMTTPRNAKVVGHCGTVRVM